MNLNFNVELAKGYKSGSQIARVLTESWVKDNMYCPRCGRIKLTKCPNNDPVKDFECDTCKGRFELKSKNGNFDSVIVDGAYDTMIEVITSNNNPDFMLMNYSKENNNVVNFNIVPKHFFVPEIIEKRDPLPETARRAGWVGCNILYEKIPPQGFIPIIKNGEIIKREYVIESMKESSRLEVKDISARGWLFDVLECVNSIKERDFCLADVYDYTDILSAKHPDNNNVEAKIRQQLQLLRDRGIIEFLGRGHYRKINGGIL